MLKNKLLTPSVESLGDVEIDNQQPVMVADLSESETTELSNEIDKINDALEETLNDTESLESIYQFLENTLPHGGLDYPTFEMFNNQIDRYHTKYGIVNRSVGLEDFGKDKYNQTLVSMETVSETLSKITKTAKKFLLNLWDKIKKFVISSWDRLSWIKRKAEKNKKAFNEEKQDKNFYEKTEKKAVEEYIVLRGVQAVIVNEDNSKDYLMLFQGIEDTVMAILRWLGHLAKILKRQLNEQLSLQADTEKSELLYLDDSFIIKCHFSPDLKIDYPNNESFVSKVDPDTESRIKVLDSDSLTKFIDKLLGLTYYVESRNIKNDIKEVDKIFAKYLSNDNIEVTDEFRAYVTNAMGAIKNMHGDLIVILASSAMYAEKSIEAYQQASNGDVDINENENMNKYKHKVDHRYKYIQKL